MLRRRAAVVAVAAACAGLVPACGRAPEPAGLRDLTGVAELKARFNRDAGKPRTVLLLSPT